MFGDRVGTLAFRPRPNRCDLPPLAAATGPLLPDLDGERPMITRQPESGTRIPMPSTPHLFGKRIT